MELSGDLILVKYIPSNVNNSEDIQHKIHESTLASDLGNKVKETQSKILFMVRASLLNRIMQLISQCAQSDLKYKQGGTNSTKKKDIVSLNKLSINRGMDKENVIFMYNKVLQSH